MKDPRVPRIVCMICTCAVAGLMLMPWPRTGAIDPRDQLLNGQDLVDRATEEIDQRVETLIGGRLDRETLYAGINGLLTRVHEFANDVVAERYRLDGPEGLLVTDGIADTLATRLHDLLREYVQHNPEEKLSVGRQALEIALSRIPIPPDRFLGFHLQHMASLYAAQSDTILSVEGIGDPAGVQDGFLRRVWDLCQLYAQVHKNAAEKYYCRIKQEDWIVQRLRCEKCSHRGLRFKNQMSGMREDTSAACLELMAVVDTSRAGILKRLNCRSWGHIFDAKCPECGEIIHFSVPLPYYRILQERIATGTEKSPDPSELIRKL